MELGKLVGETTSDSPLRKAVGGGCSHPFTYLCNASPPHSFYGFSARGFHPLIVRFSSVFLFIYFCLRSVCENDAGRRWLTTYAKASLTARLARGVVARTTTTTTTSTVFRIRVT